MTRFWKSLTSKKKKHWQKKCKKMHKLKNQSDLIIWIMIKKKRTTLNIQLQL